MSTLPLHAANAPQVNAVPAFVRLGAFLKFLVEAYADAQNSMREAQKKYPYAGI